MPPKHSRVLLERRTGSCSSPSAAESRPSPAVDFGTHDPLRPSAIPPDSVSRHLEETLKLIDYSIQASNKTRFHASRCLFFLFLAMLFWHRQAGFRIRSSSLSAPKSAQCADDFTDAATSYCLSVAAETNNYKKALMISLQLSALRGG